MGLLSTLDWGRGTRDDRAAEVGSADVPRQGEMERHSGQRPDSDGDTGQLPDSDGDTGQLNCVGEIIA